MKSKELSGEYHVDAFEFEQFLVYTKKDYKTNFTQYEVPDDKVEEYVKEFKECIKRMSTMIVTTGPFVEGMSVSKHLGIVSSTMTFNLGYAGQEAMQYFGTASGNRQMNTNHVGSAFVDAKNSAYGDIVRKAAMLGANGIISIIPNSAYCGSVVCFSYFGTAVILSGSRNNKPNALYDNNIDRTVDSSRCDQSPVEVVSCDDLASNEIMVKDELQEDDDGDDAVKAFLKECKSVDSIMGIYRIWLKYSFDIKYPMFDNYLNKKKSEEEKFGRFTKSQIDNILSELSRVLK